MNNQSISQPANQLTNNFSIYQSAIDFFGWIHQVDQTVEECSELITSLHHYIKRKATAEDVASEIADVEIMCAQMRLLFPGVDDAKAKKLERLEGMIAGQ